MIRKYSAALLLGITAVALVGCAGGPQRQPPIFVFPDMRNQGKYKPQTDRPFFSDHRASRMPVAGTVPLGQLKEDEPYFTGGSGGTQRKHKFIKCADVVVLENAGNAYLMAVYDGKKLFEIGKVFAGTTNASRKLLDAALGRGEKPVCEIRYLYAYPQGSLYQPVYLGVRDDLTPEACSISQLKYKPSEDDEA